MRTDLKHIFMLAITGAVLLIGSYGKTQISVGTDPTASKGPVIVEVDQGACWLQALEGGIWKLASFNDGVVGFYNKTDGITRVMEASRKVLPSYFGDVTSVGATLTCTGAGHRFYYDLKSSTGHRACVGTKLDHQELKFYPADTTQTRCSPYIESQILLIANDRTVGTDMAKNIYMDPILGPMVERVDHEANSIVLVVQLKSDYRYKEAKALAAFRADSYLKTTASSIGYNYVVGVAGETQTLF